MKALKYIATVAVITCSFSAASAQGKKLASTLGTDGLALESGLIAYERDIKFNYQQHAENVTEYSIAFFENADSLEFWGHGRNYLGIYGPIQKTLDGEEREEFTRRVNECYTTFKTTVKNKGRIYQHVDIDLYENMVFTCYMDFKDPRYAFWVNQRKYEISEAQFLRLLAKLDAYFK